MKGIVLAGGSGSRLFPITKGVSKQLLPIYDKPLIYYPISVLMLAGLRDILIITTEDDKNNFKKLLGDGSEFGVNFEYATQPEPKGLAEAFIIGEDFIGSDDCCLILGDNIFWGDAFSNVIKTAIKNNEGATVFGYPVIDPERYGIAEFDGNGKVISIEEKPLNPKSNFAVTGLYIYDNNVVNIAKQVRPSARGELEITSINQQYLENKKLKLEILGRGFAWLDTGTTDYLLEASSFVAAIERRQGYKIACLEEIALVNNWLNKKDLLEKANQNIHSSYFEYLKKILN